jgi:hypothetical protein
MSERESLSVIRTYFDSMSADLAQAILRAEGIESILLGDGAGGWQPTLSFVNGIRLCVPDSMAEEAIAILDLPPVKGPPE